MTPTKRTNIVTSDVPKPNGHYAQAVLIKDPVSFLFVSGTSARTPEGTIAGIGDITEQTHQVCRNLTNALAAAGGTLDDIVRLDVFVSDISMAPQIREVRRQYFTGAPPASTMVQVSAFRDEGLLIEVNAIALLGK